MYFVTVQHRVAPEVAMAATPGSLVPANDLIAVLPHCPGPNWVRVMSVRLRRGVPAFCWIEADRSYDLPATDKMAVQAGSIIDQAARKLMKWIEAFTQVDEASLSAEELAERQALWSELLYLPDSEATGLTPVAFCTMPAGLTETGVVRPERPIRWSEAGREERYLDTLLLPTLVTGMCPISWDSERPFGRSAKLLRQPSQQPEQPEQEKQAEETQEQHQALVK